jgi:signal peptide peptidase SppA
MNLASVPHFDQWLGLWAMDPARLSALHAAAMGLDLHVHLPAAQAAAAQSQPGGWPLQMANGVAVVHLRGTLMKSQASFGTSTSTVLARRQIRDAADRHDVRAMLLFIESGGGTVAGTAELGDAIAAAGKQKPVWGYCEDLCGSAAYWAASQCLKVFANASAIVGSIGTYGVVYDSSGRAEREGIKVHVIRAGAFKGAGTPGTKVEAEHLAHFQKLVDGHNAMFTAAVAAGRRMTGKRVAELADGRAHLAGDALKLGLIDGVSTWEQTFQAISQLAAGQGPSPAAAGGSKTGARSMDAISQWEAAIQEKLDRSPRMTRGEAVRQVVREDPELHSNYLQEYNARIRDAAAARRRGSPAHR